MKVYIPKGVEVKAVQYKGRKIKGVVSAAFKKRSRAQGTIVQEGNGKIEGTTKQVAKGDWIVFSRNGVEVKSDADFQRAYSDTAGADDA